MTLLLKTLLRKGQYHNHLYERKREKYYFPFSGTFLDLYLFSDKLVTLMQNTSEI
jgi:hypothetical protein